MEECYPIKRQNPRENASYLSRLFYIWMGKICYEGNKNGLELDNIYKSQEKDKSEHVVNHLERVWGKEVERGKLKDRKTSLLKVLFKAYIYDFIPWAVLMFVHVILIRSLQPLVLASFIKLFMDRNYNSTDIIIYGGGLCALSIASPFLYHHITCGVNLMGMRIRTAISSLIYRKIMKLSQSSLSKTTTGHIVNLLSNDVARFDIVMYGLNFLWIAPIQVILIGYLMWNKIGPSSLAGLISLMILTFPLQMVMGSITTKYRKKATKKTDYRVKIMSEILSGIQVIKMYSWENAFEKMIGEARKKELKDLMKTSYVQAIIVSFLIFMERATLAITLICYVIIGHEIRADLVFSLSMFFNLLQLTLGFMFPIAIATGAETLVSIKRLQDFLLLEEKTNIKISESSDKTISLKNVDACWVPPAVTLKNLNIKIPNGSLCAIIGPVGAGKSSLLKVLLGELTTSSGSVQLSGDISYSSQESWIFASTVRNNILFGENFNDSLYKEIVKSCALEKDFEQFPEGDSTRVGDRGVSLSGGQRARINLARAVYKNADIYLLDDPLSAVDTNVGRHLFEECILNYLNGKTRILVTHQLQYLKRADMIIVLNKGTIEAQGTFEELSQTNLDFTKLLVAADETEEDETKKTKKVRTISTTEKTEEPADESLTKDKVNENAEEKSNYSGSVLWAYIKSTGSLPQFIFLMFLFIFCQVISSGADYWITLWTSQAELRHRLTSLNTTVLENSGASNFNKPRSFYAYDSSENQIESNENKSYLYYGFDFTDRININNQDYVLLKTEVLMYVYTFLIVSTIVVSILRSGLYFYSCMKASKNLHNKMFHCLLEAPMRFFDTNPVGRVLNRFSKDIGAIDDLMPKSLVHVVQILLVLTGILMMVIISNPYILIIIIFLSVVFVKIRNWYIKAAREMKLIEGIAKSPVFSYVSSTFDGLITIRATKNEKVLMKQFDQHQDVHTSAWYLTVLCSVSFGLWLDLVCVIFVCAVIISFVILDQFTDIGGSFIGLGISQSLILVGMLQFGMRQVSEVVNYITSVERVLEYTEIKKEEPLYSPKEKLPQEPWPNEGKIIFENVILRYVPTDAPVLNNLNFEIHSSEKVGIVGRTGAGKSSLIAALFRLTQIEGKIIIDDIDVSNLGLRDLRKKISIIPQEPVLFSASVRHNLDPFSEFEDKKLWETLDEVELKEKIQSLDFMVTEGGSNFSVGQRQLICLARAILRNNKILILDEATANVDLKTDEVIQKTIRRKFENCTVLTIAHRLNTIMDSDRVLVMDTGCVVELDHPHVLLQNPDGHLSKMLRETGSTMEQNLKDIALQTYLATTSITPL